MEHFWRLECKVEWMQACEEMCGWMLSGVGGNISQGWADVEWMKTFKQK